MPIRSWQQGDRPRERLLSKGPQYLSDAELVAILLRSGVPGTHAVDLARDSLAALGGLRGLLEADQSRVCALPGWGPVKYAQLQAGLELGRRFLQARLPRGSVFQDTDSTRAFVAARLTGRPREVFACLFLDVRHRLISYEEMFEGTIDGTSVHPREVVRRALEINASALIVAHNHPSGMAEPSQADRSLTRHLSQACDTVALRLLDHLVVGETEVVSFADRGWI